MVFRSLLLGLICLLTSACSTTDYVTHYGIFSAENSAGEFRQFRIHWQTLRYQGWSKDVYRAFPVVLETQCSKRKIHMSDASFGGKRKCERNATNGIAYCGDSKVDVDRRGLEIDTGMTCLHVTDRSGSQDILSLEGDVLLTVSCRPKQTQKRVAGKKVNIDYLLSSESPYVVSTKTVNAKDIDLFIPALSKHSSICDPDA